MKNIKNIMKGGAILALTLILTLSACGTSSDNTAESEEESAVIEETNTIFLIGTWDSEPNDNNTYYEAVVSDNDGIAVYQFNDDKCYLYWNGTCETSINNDPYTYTSINSFRNTETDTIRTDKTMSFTYLPDDECLRFYYDSQNEDDIAIGIRLTRISNDYCVNYTLSDINNLTDEISADNEITNETADIETEADITVNDTAEEQMNETNISVTDEQNTANNNANNTADTKENNTETSVSNNDDTNTVKTGYTYTDKNETMYTTYGLNVRSGPMTNYGVIGSYDKGDAVTVTGVCNETGWTRVNYNGQTGYVDSNYLTSTAPANNNTSSNNTQKQNTQETSQPVQNTVQTETYTSGGFPLYNYTWLNGQYLGRVRIPSVGINVAIYNSSAQSVTDANDSANFYYMADPPAECNYTIICSDHSNQGFDCIKNCTIGTALYIDSIDGNTYKYICDRVEYNGHCDFVHLYDSNWNIADNDPNSGLWLQTCNNMSGTSVTLVHFYAA